MSDSRPIGLAPGVPVQAAGQDERKYRTRNPVVRILIRRWLRRLHRAVGERAGVLIDVGSGEGFAIERIAPPARLLVGVDYRSDKLRRAVLRVPHLRAVRADAGMLPFGDGAGDVVACIEVLEHLTDPARAVAELARVTGERCVVSVPWEPVFRVGNLLRGRNFARWGDDPEHVQHYSRHSLAHLLRTSFREVDVTRCVPWLVAVARRPEQISRHDGGPR